MRIERALLERLCDRLPGLSRRQAVETAIAYYLDIADALEEEEGPPSPAQLLIERRDPASPGARMRNG